ncbi:Zn-dependent exopeptidase [Eremomyces bilateralis CBS 781.70]|uniref:Zn-dependent exopeptidase n=1 Tax=Eremomyces bilateralis CBS 781.70 TaxID=1392243 RepID=A0A6G1GBP9_9PEZI|nr:Zn-dependent exopeptidase [Eremomyces bilateralis CBS 781.70]KAF1815402.1 Zn-dependent exopeptidase [Eremomyces bilateralis CBS 781.70]
MRFPILASLALVPIQVLSVQLPLKPMVNQAPMAIPGTAKDSPLAEETRKELWGLHKSLVNIESITENENEVAKWLESYLQQRGLKTELQEVSPDRFNVLAYPEGRRESRVLVTSHIDTVPPFYPWEYNESTNVVSGRGSVDAKGSVAAQVIAALDVVKGYKATQNAEPSLSLLYVVGEETGGDGMAHFSSHKPCNYASVIFGEPTEGKLASGHKGNLGLKLMAKGKASHSGYPWLGLNAIDILIEALRVLKGLVGTFPTSDKYGETTLNIGKIDGGVAANVVPAESHALLAFRLATGSAPAQRERILAAIETVQQRAEERGGGLETEWEAEGYGPMDLDADVPGFETMVVNYGTDIPNLAGDHKKYLYGPGSIQVAHGPNEELTVSELEEAVKGYKTLIEHALEDTS